MTSLQIWLRRAVAVGGSALVLSAPLQAAQGRSGDPRYDLATETSVNGIVESIEQLAPSVGAPGRRGIGGTHLTLKTATETLNVHLGPTAFLTEKKVAIAKGDTLVILGSRVKVGDDTVFIAREVKKGDTAWTLRDAAGLPLWRGRGRRAPSSLEE